MITTTSSAASMTRSISYDPSMTRSISYDHSNSTTTLRKCSSLPILNKINYKELDADLVKSNKKISLRITSFSVVKNKKHLKCFIKIHPTKNNYIGVYFNSKKSSKKNFNCIFDNLDTKNKIVKSLSHPVRNMIFTKNKDQDQIIFISVRKKQDKIKLLKLPNSNINKEVSGNITSNINKEVAENITSNINKEVAENITSNLNPGLINDIVAYKDSCIISIANDNKVSILQCNNLNETDKKWNELFSFGCDDLVSEIKFSDKGNLIFTLLADNSIVIYKITPEDLTWEKLIKLDNFNCMPLNVSADNEVLICDANNLYVIDTNQDNITQSLIMNTKYIEIKSACFINKKNIIVNLYDKLADKYTTCIYHKTDLFWEVDKNIKLNKEILDIKKNSETENCYVLYTN